MKKRAERIQEYRRSLARDPDRLRSVVLRRELADLERLLAEVNAAGETEWAAARALSLAVIRGDGAAVKVVAGHEANAAECKFKARRLMDAKDQLIAELRGALEEEARAAAVEETEEFKRMADVIKERGRELGEHFAGMLECLKDLRDDLANVRARGGNAPSGEATDVGLKDLLRSVFASLPWVQMPMPNRRWTAGELAASWASAVRGSGLMRVLAETAVSPNRKPGAVPEPDIAMSLPGDHPNFKIYDTVVDGDAAHQAAIRGPQGG